MAVPTIIGDYVVRRTNLPPRIGVYLGTAAEYAGAYLLRQAQAIGSDAIIGGHLDIPTDRPLRSIGYSAAAFEQVSLVATVAMRRLGCSSLEPLQTRRLRAATRDIDVVYTMFLGAAQDLVPLQRASGMAIAVHAAGADVTTLKTLRSGYQKASLRVVDRADLLLCGSVYLQQRLEAIAPGRRTHLHYIGVRVPLGPRPEPQSSHFQFLAVSRMHPVKGLDRTISAFSRLLGVAPDCRLVILGDGPQRSQLEKLVRELGISHAVEMPGYASRGSVDDAMRKSHVFLQHNVPLRSGADEALGGSIVEAQSYGLPVVATRTGGVPEVVIDGVTGFLVMPGDVGSMTNAMETLVASPSIRHDFGNAGHEVVRVRHNAAAQDRTLGHMLRNL